MKFGKILEFEIADFFCYEYFPFGEVFGTGGLADFCVCVRCLISSARFLIFYFSGGHLGHVL